MGTHVVVVVFVEGKLLSQLLDLLGRKIAAFFFHDDSPRIENI